MDQKPMMQDPNMVTAQPMMQQQNPNMYVQQPLLVQPMSAAPIMWGPLPQEAKCCHCGHVGMTNVDKTLTGMGWLIVFILYACGLWLCCWIPCIIDDLKCICHKCSSCDKVLGIR